MLKLTKLLSRIWTMEWIPRIGVSWRLHRFTRKEIGLRMKTTRISLASNAFSLLAAIVFRRLSSSRKLRALTKLLPDPTRVLLTKCSITSVGPRIFCACTVRLSRSPSSSSLKRQSLRDHSIHFWRYHANIKD